MGVNRAGEKKNLFTDQSIQERPLDKMSLPKPKPLTREEVKVSRISQLLKDFKTWVHSGMDYLKNKIFSLFHTKTPLLEKNPLTPDAIYKSLETPLSDLERAEKDFSRADEELLSIEKIRYTGFVYFYEFTIDTLDTFIKGCQLYSPEEMTAVRSELKNLKEALLDTKKDLESITSTDKMEEMIKSSLNKIKDAYYFLGKSTTKLTKSDEKTDLVSRLQSFKNQLVVQINIFKFKENEFSSDPKLKFEFSSDLKMKLMQQAKLEARENLVKAKSEAL